MQSKFISQLQEQARLHRAWMFAAIGFALLAGYLAHELSTVSGRVNSILLPYNVATSRGPISVTNANNARNASYLTMIALSDVSVLTNWTPDTVKSQTARLVARLAPAYRAHQEHGLLAQAEKNTAKQITQTFYVTGTTVKGSTVSVIGTLERWKKGQPQTSANLTWKIRYQYVSGVPMITSLNSATVGATDNGN